MASGFTANEVERGLRKAAEPGINKAMRELAAKLQSVLDDVSGEVGGQPTEVVEPVLDRELRIHGYEHTTERLSSWAVAIAEGHRIEVRAETVRL